MTRPSHSGAEEAGGHGAGGKEAPETLRVLHFSDIHVGGRVRNMHLKRWLSKRAIGAINLLRGRAAWFDDAPEKLEALGRFAEEQRIDLVINTGDYTALGMKRELEDARALVDPLTRAPLGFITVPGNHDIYVSESRSHRRFSEEFGEFLTSDLPEYQSDDRWPLVRLIDDRLAVISVNSARPNPWPWKSNGIIEPAELEQLRALLRDPALRERTLFIALHYAPRLASGEPDTHLHGLINADEFLDALDCAPRSLVLCGHVHQTYHLVLDARHKELFCAGSATMDGHEGIWVYECSGADVTARKGRWNREAKQFSLVDEGVEAFAASP